MTVVISSGSKSRAVTEGDRLWLARAVQAEGEPRKDVAQALVNLWISSGSAGSLGDLVRAYAQPVNPRWFASGDLHRRALARAKSHAEVVSMESAARKREKFHSTRTVFDPDVLRAVSWALDGDHRTDVTDYAASWVDAARKGYIARSEASRGVNRLWTRFPGIRGYSASAGGVSLLAIALVLVVVAGVVYA